MNHGKTIVATAVARENLTRRRLDVLRSLALGDKTNDVGRRLKLTHHTITVHIVNLRAHFNVGHKSAIIPEAFKCGYLQVVPTKKCDLNANNLPYTRDGE